MSLLSSGLFGADPHQVTMGEGGFSSLAEARDHVWTLSKDRPVVVTIQPGIYSFDRWVDFKKEEGGWWDGGISSDPRGGR